MKFLENFPTFTGIFHNAFNTLKRFPLPMVAAISATICGLILSENNESTNEFFVQKILMFSCLGIPLFIALKMFVEKFEWKQSKSLGLQVIGFLLLLLYYFLTPENFEYPEKYSIQYFLFFVFVLFLNAFLPFIKEKSIQGFWQYNKTLFLNFFISMLYSHVMGLGLILALAAMDHLFNMDIDAKRYLQIWIIVSILFNSTVFMSKIPSDLKKLESDYSYPNGLKVFIQYILLPLVGLYILILYTYEVKIIFEWNWPIGWVSNLVLWYSVVSILSLLLLYPLREQKENRWIQVFSKWFFRALVPLVVMLFLAIVERISTYGITELRYAVFAMSIGLAVVVLYFIISKSKDIRIIPIVISLFALLSAIGPWSAWEISKSSQQNRLENLLIENKMFVDGSLVSLDESIDFETRKDMSSIVDYLLTTHGVDLFNIWVDDSLIQNYKEEQDAEANQESRRYYRNNYNSDDICSLLGFDYEYRWSSENSGEYFYINADKTKPIDIENYDNFYMLPNNLSNLDSEAFKIDSLSCFIQKDEDDPTFAIYIGDTLSTFDDLGEINLTDTLSSLRKFPKSKKFNPDDLSFIFTGETYEVKIVFYRISGYDKENISINSFEAVLLLKKK